MIFDFLQEISLDLVSMNSISYVLNPSLHLSLKEKRKKKSVKLAK